MTARVLPLAVLALLMSACTLGPDFARPEGVDEPFAVQHTAAPGAPTVAIDDAWWRGFDDPLLNGLIESALGANLELEAAALRVEQSRVALQVSDADGAPQVAAGADYGRQRNSAKGLSDPSGKDGKGAYSLWQTGIAAGWGLDLWGRLRRQHEAAQASVQASAFEASGVRLAVIAETAQDYIRLRGTQATLAVVEDNLSQARQGLALSRIREQDGVATRLDVAEAAAQVATFEAQVPMLEQRRDALFNALGLLLAEAPGALQRRLHSAQAVPQPRVAAPPALPSQLARRRPDILRAEALLHAATARIGMAQADFYPRISLSGNLGLQALQLDNLGWGARSFGIGPQLSLPLFDGGRLHGQLQLSQTAQRLAALDYRRTVLRAWHEVDNALSGYRYLQRRRASLEQAVAQNRQAVASAQQQYAQGTVDYLNVLAVQNALLASQQAQVQSSAEASLALVELYKALGGGWQAANL